MKTDGHQPNNKLMCNRLLLQHRGCHDFAQRSGALRRVVILISICVLSASPLRAENIGGSTTGEALKQFLRANYRPSDVLSYGAARKEMVRDIENRNGNVRCVYTGARDYHGGDP